MASRPARLARGIGWGSALADGRAVGIAAAALVPVRPHKLAAQQWLPPDSLGSQVKPNTLGIHEASVRRGTSPGGAVLVDAHAHLDRFGDRLDEAILQIEEHRILTLAVAMDVPSYLATKSLASRSRRIRPLFGVHPWEAPRYADDLQALDVYFAETPMIGEAGLDFHFIEDKHAHKHQRRVFRYQCEWAARCGKRMNLHTKGAEAEVLDELHAHGLRGSIVHWYSGPADLVPDYLALGCYFTVGVEVCTSAAVRKLAASLPRERLLLETDNPGAHEWLTGSPGMPALILDVRDAVAELRGVTPAELQGELEENWRRVDWRSAPELDEASDA